MESSGVESSRVEHNGHRRPIAHAIKDSERPFAERAARAMAKTPPAE
jgi:hypothetical protein